MIDKFNKMKDEFKTVKELEKQLLRFSETDVDLSNPQNMMESFVDYSNQHQSHLIESIVFRVLLLF